MVSKSSSRRLPGAAYGLLDLLHSEGYGENLGRFLNDKINNEEVPGICWGCGHTEDVLPEEDRGWCVGCKRNSMRSASVLVGIV